MQTSARPILITLLVGISFGIQNCSSRVAPPSPASASNSLVADSSEQASQQQKITKIKDELIKPSSPTFASAKIWGSFSKLKKRAPASENEKSLLYWRYLCEGKPQHEIVITQEKINLIELACYPLGWRVFAVQGDDEVTSVEDGGRE